MMERLDWFAGNTDALDFYRRLVSVAHAWDDLVDGDKEMSPREINRMVENLILYMPGNPFYRQYEEGIRAHLFSSMAGYQAANIMEKSGDSHKIEIAHYLRYAVVNVVTFMFVVIHGIEGAATLLAEVAPILIPERLADYAKEHQQ